MVLCGLYHSLLSTYDLANGLYVRQSIMMQRLEAISHQRGETLRNTLSVCVLSIVLDVMPSRHVCLLVPPTVP